MEPEDFTSLSLDLGSTFGYAKGRNGVIEASGEVSLAFKDAHPGNRYLVFTEWLNKNAIGVQEILFEDVFGFKSSVAAKVHGGLLSHLEVFCLQNKIRMCSLRPNQIKKDFTGKGNADKEAMCETAINLGWLNGRRGTRDRNNECDAIAIFWCIWARRLVQPRFAEVALQENLNLV